MIKQKRNPLEGERTMINLIYTILPVVCLITGFYFGFKIGKTLELPSIPEKVKHPIKTIIEEKEQKEAESELNKALKNLDNFDGTSESQEDI
jgi:hypothetical protein